MLFTFALLNLQHKKFPFPFILLSSVQCNDYVIISLLREMIMR